MVTSEDASSKVFAGGQLASVGKTPKDASGFFDRTARAVLRANLCTKCGICVRTCPSGSIRLDDTLTVDERKCTRCGKCAESCVVAHYFDKLAGDMSEAVPATKKNPRKGRLTRP
jgi:phosphoadenosine phosphosulfate reductase